MTKPVTIPNTFATATTAIPLSQLDSDFSTVATALNDANTYSNYAADTGVANAYVVTLTGVSTTYSAGLRIQFKAGNANTGASTLNVNGGGTKNITFQDASALSSGTIAANAIVDVMYDGTQFLLMNDPAGTVGTGDVVGPAGATANAAAIFDSTTGKLIKDSKVIITPVANSSTLTIANNKTVTVNNTLTLSGTDSTTMTFPSTSATIARTDSAQTFTGVQTFSSNPILSGGTANGVLYLNGSSVATSGSGLVFDSSGNLGLGVTPSAWSAHKVLQIGAWSSFGSFNGNLNAQMMNNAYWDGSAYRYIGSGQASYFSTGQGSFQWNIAASGTAGNAITFTQAMTLDASGLLGIGTTSPAGLLDIQGTQTFSLLMTRFGSAANTALRRANGTQASPTIINNGEAIHQITFQGYDGVSAYQSAARISAIIDGATISASSMPGALLFATTASGSTTVTERARITSGGDFGIGTSSWPSGQRLRVAGGDVGFEGQYLYLVNANADIQMGAGQNSKITNTDSTNTLAISRTGASSIITLSTAGSERARITSGGALLVGTTNVPDGTTAWGVGFEPGLNSRIIFKTGVNTTSAASLCAFYNPNGIVGTIQTSGSATSYNTSSDYRMKNTITPMTGALAKVALLKPCTYKWNVDGSDGEGFIAHELAEVCPQAVSGEKDAVDAEGNPQYQGIDTSFLVATLTAAIQEQQALITSLTARVAALEGTQP